ncbi:MAG: hypothetical protein GY820_12710 [Gammaproteobacteria bacterium]|nr:hypothetical protein [Bacteroidota bacterium]MCP4488164.1 hypothetical protein [Gammaproteobacteria bacterium]
MNKYKYGPLFSVHGVGNHPTVHMFRDIAKSKGLKMGFAVVEALQMWIDKQMEEVGK